MKAALATLLVLLATAGQNAPVVVVLETEKGTIELEIDAARAPITAANFLKYVDGRFYDGGVVNRAVRADNTTRQDVKIEVIQFQIDPARRSEQFPPIALERTSVTGLKHVDGVISMARSGPDTATGSFFIAIGNQPELDFGGKRNADGQGFAAFGRVTRGMDVVKAIQAAPTGKAGAYGTETLEPPIKVLRAYRKQAAAGAPADPDEAVRQWRVKHEADYTRDFVSIAGLHQLKPGANTAGSAASNDIVLPPSTPAVVGGFILTGQAVRFEPASGARVTLRGQPVTTAIELRDDRTRETDELVIGGVRIVIHVSGDTRTVRVRDPGGPLAKGFLGFSWFPIDPKYRVTGRMIRDAKPQRLKVLNTYNHADDYTSEGVVEFQLEGRTLRLRPFTTRPGRLYFVFRDASSGNETYETARFLYSDLKDDGTTVLDFNMAYNPPCAFNPYTTCPIPLKENRLPVKILAGEKAYPAPVKKPG